ncbi:MAG: DNA adenine methylase [Anaerolineales bacterium]
MKKQINYFLRYPGGKRRLLDFLINHLPSPESIEGYYIEPFVGSGAVFFYLQPQKALLSDANPELIDIYRGIRYSPKRVWEAYKKFGSTKEDYKKVRDGQRSENVIDKAARMLFLNRTCFKGMWRHNREGKFNVGYGGQSRRWVISEEDLLSISIRLRKAKIYCSDFEAVIKNANKGDFLFLDPPYKPHEQEYTNSHYVWQQFRFGDHQRLAKALRQAQKRGVKWAMTTSAHPNILALFHGFYVIKIPQGTGNLPGIMTKNSGEVLISSYKTKGSTKL